MRGKRVEPRCFCQVRITGYYLESFLMTSSWLPGVMKEYERGKDSYPRLPSFIRREVDDRYPSRRRVGSSTSLPCLRRSGEVDQLPFDPSSKDQLH